MTTSQSITFGLLELLGWVLIYRLWTRPLGRGMLARILWSLVLLVPLLGVLLYLFLTIDPGDNGDQDRGFEDASGS